MVSSPATNGTAATAASSVASRRSVRSGYRSAMVARSGTITRVWSRIASVAGPKPSSRSGPWSTLMRSPSPASASTSRESSSGVQPGHGRAGGVEVTRRELGDDPGRLAGVTAVARAAPNSNRSSLRWRRASDERVEPDAHERRPRHRDEGRDRVRRWLPTPADPGELDDGLDAAGRAAQRDDGTAHRPVRPTSRRWWSRPWPRSGA